MKMRIPFQVSVVTLSTLACSVDAAPTYTDDELFNNGFGAYYANPTQCVKAAEFLFAYALRNPPVFQQNPQHRAQVQQAITYCENNAAARVAGTEGKADSPTANSAVNKPDISRQPSTVVGNPQKRCNVYATIAVAQNQSNVANHCSFSGSRWDSRFNYHFDWCVTAPGNEARGETMARQSLLDQCTP